MNQLISFKNYTFIIACLLFNIVGLVPSNAATINVNSINALQTACNNSSAGDIIVLANGTYNRSRIIVCLANHNQGFRIPNIIILES